MTETKRYRLVLELVEDLHSGSGTGAGDIDALQMRDRRGKPVIRASHLKGLMLAAGEELAALDSDSSIPKRLHALLGHGGGGKGRLRLTSAYLDGGSRGETLLWISAARADGERRPKDESMRIVEHVSAGNTFIAQLRLPADAEDERLIVRLIRRIDRIGGDRNRGGGLVHSRLDMMRGEPLGVHEPKTKVLRLYLRNLDPLCLPDTGHPGNLITSHAFIRGQMLRGAFMAWALARNDAAALSSIAAASVGDALPLPPGDGDIVETMPIPLSLKAPKPDGGSADLPWWIGCEENAQAYDDLGEMSGPDVDKPKRPGAREFVAPRQDGSWLRYAPAMRVHMRNHTPDLDSMGKRQAEPELFSMEEIAEQTSFVAKLRFDDPETANAFSRLFAPVLSGGEWLAIGRGGRPVEVVKVADVPSVPVREFKDDWTLTLLSDTVVRGEHLGFLTGLDILTLCRLAGMEALDWKMLGISETVRLHGFNAASGLRRTPVLAIRRGSCWRITGAGSHKLAEALACLPAIGERTLEGCGRFAIDVQPITGLVTPEKGEARLENNCGESLRRAAWKIAGEKWAQSPSPSQLQWLRSRALAAEDEKQMFDLLDELRNAPIRRPKGGGVWTGFAEHLGKEFTKRPALEEKRLLVSSLVQRLVFQAKYKAQGKRS